MVIYPDSGKLGAFKRQARRRRPLQAVPACGRGRLLGGRGKDQVGPYTLLNPEMADPAPLLVVDAPSLLFRAYYALPGKIKDAEGRPVMRCWAASISCSARSLRIGPRAVVMAFGQDAADYRVELFPDYHADRRELEADEDIERQFDVAPGLYEAFGWRSVSFPASRPTTCSVVCPRGTRRRRRTADPDRRSRHVPVRRDARCCT